MKNRLGEWNGVYGGVVVVVLMMMMISALWGIGNEEGMNEWSEIVCSRSD